MRDRDSLILESLYFSKVLVFESLKGKISTFKIDDPFLINFIAIYENILPWNKIRNKEDIQNEIKILLQNILDRVDYDKKNENPKTLYTTRVNWERERNILKGMADNGDDAARRTLEMYDRNPEDAQRKIIEDSNRNKRTIFQSYINYMLRDNEIYKNNFAFVYIVFSSVFSKTSNSTIAGLVPLNQAIISSIYDKIKSSPTEQFNVSDYYEQKSVRLAEMEYETTESGDGKWIKIPARYNDEENFEKNVNQLMSLAAGTNWCIAGRSFAKRYLDGGDFYIYFEEVNGKAIGRAAIRMNGDQIAEIRGTEEGQAMNDKYVENVLDLVRKEGLEGGEEFVSQLQFQKQMVPMMEKARNNTITEEDLIPLMNVLKSQGYEVQIKRNTNIPLPNGRMEIMFTHKTYDASDFAEDFDKEKLKSYVPYYTGDDFLDVGFVEIEDYYIKRILPKLNPNTKMKLENYARENGWDENETDLDDWVVESDLIDSFSRAYNQGRESGTSSEIYKAINDYMDEVWFLQKFDHDNYYISISVLRFLEIYTKYKSDFEDGNNIDYILKDEDIGDLVVPYHGFDGYDEDVAVESLEDELSDILK